MVEIYGYSIATVPLIAAVVYAVIEFIKYCDIKHKLDKWLPIFAGVLGAAVAIVLFFTSPELIPAAHWLSAIIIGIASGFSAVGINQIKKQTTKGEGKGNGS